MLASIITFTIYMPCIIVNNNNNNKNSLYHTIGIRSPYGSCDVFFFFFFFAKKSYKKTQFLEGVGLQPFFIAIHRYLHQDPSSIYLVNSRSWFEDSAMADHHPFTPPTISKFNGFYDHWTELMENLLWSKE